MKKVLFVLFLLLNAYVVITESAWYRDSVIASGTVSRLHITSSAERRMLDRCDHFRGRTDCSTLYDYDVTWRAKGRDWTWHVDKARIAPDTQICMNVVAGEPALAKPCGDWFFIQSRIPALIMMWAIVAFIALTVLIHRFAVSRRAKRRKFIYRVCTPRRELLLETENAEEAERFIGSRYRVCATFRTQETRRQGRRKIRGECIRWHVRPKKGP